MEKLIRQRRMGRSEKGARHVVSTATVSQGVCNQLIRKERMCYLILTELLPECFLVFFCDRPKGSGP